MRIDKYIVISATKRYSYSSLSPHIKLVERTPTLKGNEVALRLQIEIPDAFFQRPILDAKFQIPKDAVPTVTISPEMIGDIEKLVKEKVGLDIHIGLVEHPEEKPQHER